MELNLHTHNFELSPRLQTYVEKKTGRLDRYMSNLAEVRVDLSEQNARNALERQVAQITIRNERGTILRAEERSNDMFAAVDAVVDKLYRQISRYRGKKQNKRRANQQQDELMMLEPLPIEEELVEEGEASEAGIVRRKRFPMRPMVAEEAMDQMELLGHDFYVFYNADDEAVNVLYRRHDGNYGLIQPDID